MARAVTAASTEWPIELIVALIGAGISVVVAVLTARWEGRKQGERLRAEAKLQSERLGSEAKLQSERLRADANLQAERLAAELRTEFMAEEAINMLLRHPRWTQRSFGAITRRIRGFSDEELRVLLVRSGAVAFGGERDKEWWGLREKNMEQLAELADADDADAPP
jgi:hypothetical protein